MKELFNVIVEKAKEIEAQILLLGFGVFTLFVLWASTAVVMRLLKTIVRIIELLKDVPSAG